MVTSREEWYGGAHEESVSADTKIVFGLRRVYLIENTSVSQINADLPDARDIPGTGGPIFMVMSATTSTGDIDVRDGAGSSILGGSPLAPGDAITLYLGDNSIAAGEWHFRRDTAGSIPNPPDAESWFTLGGADTAVAQSDQAFQYDAQIDSWSSKTSGTDRMFESGAASTGPVAYVTGSASSSSSKFDRTLEYDPDAWSSKADMLQTSNRHSLTLANGNLYAIGFRRGAGDNWNNTDQYEPPGTDTWTMKADISADIPRRERARSGAVNIGGAIYKMGGQAVGSDSGNFADKNDEYQPSTDTWSEKGNIPFPGRWGGNPVAKNPSGDDKAILIGATPNGLSTPTDDVDEYTASTDSWASKGDHPDAIFGAFGGEANGVGYSTCGPRNTGQQNSPSDKHEAYDFGNDAWSTKEVHPNPKFWAQSQGVAITS